MNLRGRFLLLIVALFAGSSAVAAGDETGPTLLASGRVDDAIAALHGQISSSPNDALAHNLLCRAYFTIGQWDRGISACEKAVALAPDNGQYHLWLGRIYGEKADKASFITAAGLAGRVRSEFETAVKLDPNSADARCDLAEFYLEAPGIVGGGKDKAMQQVGVLAGLDPGRAHWVSARIAEKRKDYATAESEYKAAVDASHGSASAWLNLGLFYRHRERYEDLEQALSHVRLAPLDRSDALVDAAEILIHAQRNLPEAMELLRAYLKLNKSVEQAPAFKVHYLLGTADEKIGDQAGAAAEYKSALSLAKEFQPAKQALERMNR
jgi:tetratricopeptide (TPR) repeat protein